MDPDFAMQEMCAGLNLYLVRDLADRVLLDVRPQEYADRLAMAVDAFEKNGVLADLAALDADPTFLVGEVRRFGDRAREWNNRYVIKYN